MLYVLPRDTSVFVGVRVSIFIFYIKLRHVGCQENVYVCVRKIVNLKNAFAISGHNGKTRIQCQVKGKDKYLPVCVQYFTRHKENKD